MSKTMSRLWLLWTPLLALTAILAACGAPVAPAPTAAPDPEPAATPDPEPPATPDPEPAARQVSCDDSAIRLLDRAAGVHGAIVQDTLHLGGATAPATCTDPTSESLQAGVPLPDGRTAQVRQSEYYLIVIRYTSGNRLYVISRRGDGTSCVVDTNDECVAEVSELPDDFDLGDLPDDVERTIPAGRPAAPTASPPAGGDDTPPGASPPPAATGPPGAAGSPQPADGATGVSVEAPLLSWAAVPGAVRYDVYWDDFESGQASWVTTTSTFVRMSARSSDGVVSGRTERLEPNTTYYWAVDACQPSTCTEGDYWSFTTGAAQPGANPPPGASPAPPDSGGGTPPTAPAPSPTCGYSQSDVISLWLGTHRLPPAPDGYVPNRRFEGQTSVTVTSTGFVVGDVTSRFWTQDRARRWHLGEEGEICDVLVASADDGRVYVLDGMEVNTNTYTGVVGGHLLANLPGSTTPACTNRWHDAQIRVFYPAGHANGDFDGAQINHEDC